MLILKCDCCGFEQDFKDGQDAFEAGWDGPPHFTGYVACNICPSVCVVLVGVTHNKAHELWAQEGRPDEFTVAKCGTDRDFERMGL